ncbi:hypothetical protein SAMN05444358_103151 [Ruegeria halocynthiae]|uniref:YMGG-like Gly-zipper domain-containing protein n=1 Tax=Ruegeria halocynthiae TaxID=985054 RepID=A0A1H2ZBT2_9RHOB|nr:YMGG-like glycine zipper-containing protein [Ruegeria halocynthiae]SDX14438.1 hypothetical protein SAMN05444358_103151 [Ruegeria halocynthiae]
MQRYSALLIPAVFLAACEGTGASYEPKLAAAPNPGYEQDLQHCRNLAKSEKVWNAETRTQALLGAAGGAVVGALEGDLGAGAVVGGAAGAASGALETRYSRKDILLECLRQRGQPVAG